VCIISCATHKHLLIGLIMWKFCAYRLMYTMVYKLSCKKAALLKGDINRVHIIWTPSDYFERERLCFLNMNCHARWKIQNIYGPIQKRSRKWICEKCKSVLKKLEVNPHSSMAPKNVHTCTTLPASTVRTSHTQFLVSPTATSLQCSTSLRISRRWRFWLWSSRYET
jgi:hypothetical protein